MVTYFRRKALRNLKTKFETRGHMKYAPFHSVKTINIDRISNPLLKEFYLKIIISQSACQTQQNTSHYNKRSYSFGRTLKINYESLRNRLDIANLCIWANSHKCSLRRLRHFDYISQYYTDIRHQQSFYNIVADWNSKIEIDSILKFKLLFWIFRSLEKIFCKSAEYIAQIWKEILPHFWS